MGMYDIVKNITTRILENPGDKMEAVITPSNRKVFKGHKNNGSYKYSATQYPNGTIVETRTIKSPNNIKYIK